MKTAICYYSRHHGNTLKVLEAMAEAAKAQAVVDEKKKVMDAALQCIEKEQGKEAADKARAAMEAAMAKEEASKTEGEDK